MSGTQLVLSLFPGIGLLDMAFEEEGFCVVRGPDLLWGGDIRRFHPPAGKFDGVIGGPPCQRWSAMANINRARGATLADDLIPEFARIVGETNPAWFVMENVPGAPEPTVAPEYGARSHLVNHAVVGGDTGRERRFTVGIKEPSAPVWIDGLALHRPDPERTVLAAEWKAGTGKQRNGRRAKYGSALPSQERRRTIAESAILQGLPEDFLEHAPFTAAGKYQVIGNGVPLPMGRAVAKAVKRALGIEVA